MWKKVMNHRANIPINFTFISQLNINYAGVISFPFSSNDIVISSRSITCKPYRTLSQSDYKVHLLWYLPFQQDCSSPLTSSFAQVTKSIVIVTFIVKFHTRFQINKNVKLVFWAEIESERGDFLPRYLFSCTLLLINSYYICIINLQGYFRFVKNVFCWK